MKTGECLSCANKLGQASNYCPSCGATVVTKRLTVGRLLNKAFTSIFNFDLPFFNTLKWLIVDPFKVTNGYINGVRKIIVSPVQFTITVLALYGLYQFIFSDFLTIASQGSYLVRFEGGLMEGFLHGVKAETNVEHKNQSVAFSNWLHKHDQFISTVMIPILAFLGISYFSKRKYNLAEHLTVALYTISLTILASISLGSICAVIPHELSTDVYINGYPILNAVLILWIYHKTMKSPFHKSLKLLILAQIIFFVIFILFIVTGAGLIEAGKMDWLIR